MGSTVSDGSTQYLQLEVYIDYNLNHYPAETEGVIQYQAEALSICNSKCTSRVAMKG
jgi:hypothetical protein